MLTYLKHHWINHNSGWRRKEANSTSCLKFNTKTIITISTVTVQNTDNEGEIREGVDRDDEEELCLPLFSMLKNITLKGLSCPCVLKCGPLMAHKSLKELPGCYCCSPGINLTHRLPLCTMFFVFFYSRVAVSLSLA